MEDLIQVILDSIIFILPLWIGNAAPTILGGGPPIDGGRYWRDGKRILGDGKTIRGFWTGTLVGGIMGGVVGFLGSIISGSLYPGIFLRLEYQNFLESSEFTYPWTYFWELNDFRWANWRYQWFIHKTTQWNRAWPQLHILRSTGISSSWDDICISDN
jgi:hypothetical protein